tara:strand:+ start:31920 stop:33074 length:1155 start_codon:yes stop_codon:yes gene_type:complete
MTKILIDELPDNYPISILNMKMKLVNKHIKDKSKFNVTNLFQKYEGTYNDFLAGGFCISLKDFKDFCYKNNIKEDLINLIIENQERLYKEYFWNNDKLKNYKREDYKNLSNQDDFKKFAQEKKGNQKKEKKEKSIIKKFLKTKKTEEAVKKEKKQKQHFISKIKDERLIFIDLEMPNNQNVLSEGAFIILDPKEKSEKSYYSILKKAHNRFVPNTREFALHRDLKNNEIEYLKILQEEINRSDVVVFHGGKQDRKLLRKKGINFDNKKIIDTQNAVGKISLENAILKVDPDYKIDISEKESEKIKNLIEKNVPDAKKKKKKYFSNIAVHNAYNDTLILANLFNKILLNNNNNSYNELMKKINKNANIEALKKVNKKSIKLNKIR